jgi:regulator of protease activity HflC (stomatin/prohibitin superfamily)
MAQRVYDVGDGVEALRHQARRVPLLVGGLILLILIWKSVVVVDAGHVGVKVLFGQVSDVPLYEGLHLINPLARVVEMSVRSQNIKEIGKSPSKEGMTVDLDVSMLFHLDPKQAPGVYRKTGPNYVTVAVEPILRSAIRGTTSAYEAKALYTSQREVLANQMEEHIAPSLLKRGVIVEEVMLRAVTLPQLLSTAIEQKLEAEQKSEQMKFVLDRERQEAERKRIEAQGISDFQDIVSAGITDSLLRWKGIEATEKLASSSNAKVVIIGSGKEGLPIILGQ